MIVGGAVSLQLSAEEALTLLDYCSMCGFAEDHDSYGNFIGGDPRDFSPDMECSTEQERAQHAEDCARWSGGEPQEPEPGPHVPIVDKVSGREVGHVTLCGYGLGVNKWRAPQSARDLVAALQQMVSP